MQIDVSTLIAIIGCAIGASGFFIGRASANKKEGEAAGEMRSDVKHVRGKVDDMDGRFERLEEKFDSEVNRLNGRIDEQGRQITQVSQIATKARASAKSSHKRIDEHLRRDHDQTVRAQYDDETDE